MVRNIFIVQLGCLPGCAPSQLLHTCWLAEYGRLEKVLEFLATTKTISVINILLILNPKYSSYWEENELHPSQNQDNLERPLNVTTNNPGALAIFPVFCSTIHLRFSMSCINSLFCAVIVQLRTSFLIPFLSSCLQSATFFLWGFTTAFFM